MFENTLCLFIIYRNVSLHMGNPKLNYFAIIQFRKHKELSSTFFSHCPSAIPQKISEDEKGFRKECY